MELHTFFKKLFSLTAWEMTPPKPYSAFHLLLCVAGIATAFFAARRVAYGAGTKNEAEPAIGAGPVHGSGSVHGPGSVLRMGPVYDHADPGRILLSCGLIFLLMELYKQGFLYFVEFDGTYDWWYFPFQLCSIPMYLSLLYPCAGKRSGMFATFIQDYGLLGGFMALLVPDGLLHPYWTMTLHGFLWHFMLIFAGLYCAFSGITDQSRRGFLKTLPLFFACCLAALAINVAAGPLSDADMFYISPYHPSSQLVFHQISQLLGILPGILIYIGAMALGAFLVHEGIRHLISKNAGTKVQNDEQESRM